MKKVMIFYAAFGGGHLSAARSIKEYIEANYTDFEVKLVDCMEYTNKFSIKLQQQHIRKWQRKHHARGVEFIGNLKKVHLHILAQLLIKHYLLN